MSRMPRRLQRMTEGVAQVEQRPHARRLALVRGDDRLSESKLLGALGADSRPSTDEEIRTAFGASGGSLGPVGFAGEVLAGAYAGIGGYFVGSWLAGNIGEMLPDASDGTRDQSKAKERWRLCVSNQGLIVHVANDIIVRLNGKAQAAFAHRARMNGLASTGKWQRSLEKAA